MRSYNDIAEKLFDQLEEHSKVILDPQKLAEIAVTEISSSLYLLRERVQRTGFDSEYDEINFFKNIKPRMVSNLTYYQFVHEFESQRQILSLKKLKNLVKNRRNRIRSEINQHREFLTYYRRNCTQLDHHYFVRSKIDCKPCALKIQALIDPGFSSSHDFQVARIMTYDLLCANMADWLANASIMDEKGSGLIFTDKKVSLIELAYSLYYSGCINNGNADIREICDQLGKAFNIEVTDFYRSFLDIKSRKGSKTKFLDRLIKDTNTAIYNLDEN